MNSTPRHPFRRIPARAVLATAALATAVALPWAANAYLVSLASTALVMAVLSMSAQLLAGPAGLAPLGQAAYLGVGAYTAALVADTVTALGPVQLIAASAAGAIAAAATGLLAVRTRAVTFLMVTVALAELLHVAALSLAPVTGGSEGRHVPPVVPLPGLAPLASDGLTYLYLLATTVVIVGCIAALMRTRFVLALRAASDHEPRLRASGHPVGRQLLAAYTIAGAIAGAAGAMLTTAHQYVSPADMAFGSSALALAAAVLGVGTMPGAFAAAIALVAVRDWLGGTTGHGIALIGLLLIAAAYLPRHDLPSLARQRPRSAP
ncbi:branched-chain amino acid ABC transporter permease [Catellatospora sp. NPDC049133]|uniref:branched-chain amino acid ABC transporter permease n=1 Tax=Catellatospora sp. NPDC049133 TaxID=3155499 RepID=UPI0033D6049D